MDKPTIVTTSTTVSRTVSSVELDGEGAALVERLENARKQISVYEAEKDEVTKALKERIGDADAASVNGVTRVVVQHVDSSNIDRKMLSELVAPEIVAKITKPNPYSYLNTLKAYGCKQWSSGGTLPPHITLKSNDDKNWSIYEQQVQRHRVVLAQAHCHGD